MISSYRLGDLLINGLTGDEENELFLEHPNSIGGKFILERSINKTSCTIDIFTKIVSEYTRENINLLPTDIGECTVIHVRLGDVVCGETYHEKSKRPFSIDYIKSLLRNGDKRYIIGSVFFAKPSSTNYAECISESKAYLDNAVESLDAEHFDGGSADMDLACAVKSKCFVQGRGFFSQLIVETRDRLGLESIKMECYTGCYFR